MQFNAHNYCSVVIHVYIFASPFTTTKSKNMSGRIPETVSPEEEEMLSKFFQEHFEYQHLLNSFNWFTSVGMPECVKARKFVMTNNRVAHIEVFRIIPPRFQFMMKDMPLTPKIALLQEMTYSIDIKVKVIITSTITGKIISESKEFTLFECPILKYSDHCYDKAILDNNLHPNDPGCYMIINGKRYVVLLYEKARLNQYMLDIDREKDPMPYIYQLSETSLGTSSTFVHLVTMSSGGTGTHVANHVILGVKVARYIPVSERIRAARAAKEVGDKTVKKTLPEKTVNVISMCYIILHRHSKANTKDSVMQLFKSTLRDVIPRDQVFDCMVLLAATEDAYEMATTEEMENTLKVRLGLKESDYAADIIDAHIRDSLFPVEVSLENKARMLMTLTARLLQHRCGFIPLSDPNHWGTRGLFAPGAIMYELLRSKMLLLQERLVEEGFASARDAEAVSKLVTEIDIGQKIMNELRAIKPMSRARGKMKATKIHGEEKSAIMLAEVLSVRDLRSMLSKHRNNIDANSPNVRHRSVEGSFFPTMDPMKATEGKNCGSTKFIALHTRTTIATDPHALTDVLFQEFEGQATVRRNKTADYSIPVFVNGLLVGYTGEYGYANCVMLKRYAVIDRECSIVYTSRVGAVEIFCDSHRLVVPVIVTDDETRRPAIFGKPGENPNNWRSLSFSALELKGYVQYLDNNEIENDEVRIAETFASFTNHDEDVKFLQMQLDLAMESSNLSYITSVKAQLARTVSHWPTYSLLHPLSAYSITCAQVQFLNRMMACRVSYSEKMENQKMSEFLDGPDEHVNYLSAMFSTRSRVMSRMSEFIGLPDAPTGKTVEIALIPLYMNQEDAFVMGSHIAEGGMFHNVETLIINVTLDVGEEFGRVNDGETGSPYAWRHINERGLPTVPAYFGPGDYVVGKYKISNGKRVNAGSRKLDSDEFGYATEVVTFRSTIAGRQSGKVTVSIRLRKISAPEVGDKFATPHGQKHIKSQTRRQEDMPFDPISGTTVGVAMNTLCMPTRMAIGTVLHPILGTDTAVNAAIHNTGGFQPNNIEGVLKSLRGNGYQDTGYKYLTDPIAGRRMKCRTMSGPGRLAALNRVGRKQVQCRGIGKSHMITGQAVASKSNLTDRGQKFGHFESMHCARYGASSVIFDRMNACCDGVTIVICRFCSSHASWIEEEEKFECKRCGTLGNGQFGLFDMSQTFTYFSVCLQSMGIRPRLALATEKEYLSEAPWITGGESLGQATETESLESVLGQIEEGM